MTQPNDETGRMFAYHEKTKHSYWSVRSSGHILDWDNQPSPFRFFEGASFIALPRTALPPRATLDAVTHRNCPKPARDITTELLGPLLYHSMAISAWKQVRGTAFRYSLRVNPSSGNLHPTETYLAVQRAEDLQDGLYHYHVRRHGLEQRRTGPVVHHLARRLGLPWVSTSPLVVLLTSIFWREAWKYRDRAYRYCLLDLGHAAASILASACPLGLHAVCLGHFPDREVADILGINFLEEGPMMMLVFNPDPEGGQAGPDEQGMPKAGELDPPLGLPNRLSPEEVPYYLLQGMHQSTCLPAATPPPAPTRTFQQQGTDSGIALPTEGPETLPIGPVARKRRSGLDFHPTAEMDLAELAIVLDHACPRGQSDYGEGLITLYAYVHRVRGLKPGVYRYHEPGRILVPVKTGDQQAAAAYLSLEQSLAGHACVAFSMVAGLDQAAARFGNRGYRYAHFEAGMIGQGLYLGAEAIGFNATGIGAFYDGEVNRYLDLQSRDGQVVYHFAIGKAIHDDRLISIQEGPDQGVSVT